MVLQEKYFVQLVRDFESRLAGLELSKEQGEQLIERVRMRVREAPEGWNDTTATQEA